MAESGRVRVRDSALMAKGVTVETTKPGTHVVIVGGGFAGSGASDWNEHPERTVTQ
jgi:hypothetical protein